MSRLGMADLGLATLNDMKENAEMIANLDTSVPLIADADTGYGGPVMVARTVTQYARAGAAALHIEDQVQTKRCGHLLGKELVSCDIFLSRIRAAVAARELVGSDIVIIARTDARQSLGFDEAAGRLADAVACGADAVFLEGLASVEEAREICGKMGTVPVLLNTVPGGATPRLSVREAKELGFRVMIFPAIALTTVLTTVKEKLLTLQTDGTDYTGKDDMGIKEAFMMCGLNECLQIDKDAGGFAPSGI